MDELAQDIRQKRVALVASIESYRVTQKTRADSYFGSVCHVLTIDVWYLLHSVGT